MDTKIKVLIKKFISVVKSSFPELYIDFEYVADLDCYQIWHNDEYLEFKDKHFRIFTTKLLSDIFLEKDIYNVFLTYDYEKSLNVDSTKYTFVDNNYGENNPVEIKYVIFGHDSDDVNKINFHNLFNNSQYISDSTQELKAKNENNKASANDFTNALAA